MLYCTAHTGPHGVDHTTLHGTGPTDAHGLLPSGRLVLGYVAAPGRVPSIDNSEATAPVGGLCLYGHFRKLCRLLVSCSVMS